MELEIKKLLSPYFSRSYGWIPTESISCI